jgi:hypothetical protein
MDTPQLRRLASVPAPTSDGFWRTLLAPLRPEPQIARLGPTTFPPYPPLRAA